MGDISTHFSRWEFKCPCCDFAVVDVELLKLLVLTRYHFNQPITITSGCRCDLHNIAVAGAYRSKHLLGIAADIIVKNTWIDDVYNFIDGHAPNKYGLKKYPNKGFIHVDVRKDKWRG